MSVVGGVGERRRTRRTVVTRPSGGYVCPVEREGVTVPHRVTHSVESPTGRRSPVLPRCGRR
jgi:hypothetical protein